MSDLIEIVVKKTTNVVSKRSKRVPLAERLRLERMSRSLPIPEISDDIEPATVATPVYPITKQYISKSLLISGFAQAYVDFFYLTHRDDPNAPVGQVKSISYSQSHLLLIANELVFSENARRKGTTADVYRAYSNLAAFLQSQNDGRTAVYFHEKCLEIAKLTSDRRGEIAAYHNLGQIHMIIGDLTQSLAYHKRQEEVAQLLDLNEEIRKACAEQAKVLLKKAEVMQSLSSEEECMAVFRQALESASRSRMNVIIGSVFHMMGDMNLRNKNPESSIQYLQEYVNCSKLNGDVEMQSEALSLLAEAYRLVGNLAQANALLQEQLEMTQNIGSASLKSRAISALSALKFQQGDYVNSGQMIQDDYDLKATAKKQKKVAVEVKKIEFEDGAGAKHAQIQEEKNAATSVSEMEMSRCHLGIVKAWRCFPHLTIAITRNDIGSLVLWKTQRLDLPTKAELSTINAKLK